MDFLSKMNKLLKLSQKKKLRLLVSLNSMDLKEKNWRRLEQDVIGELKSIMFQTFKEFIQEQF